MTEIERLREEIKKRDEARTEIIREIYHDIAHVDQYIMIELGTHSRYTQEILRLHGHIKDLICRRRNQAEYKGEDRRKNE